MQYFIDFIRLRLLKLMIVIEEYNIPYKSLYLFWYVSDNAY